MVRLRVLSWSLHLPRPCRIQCPRFPLPRFKCHPLPPWRPNYHRLVRLSIRIVLSCRINSLRRCRGYDRKDSEAGLKTRSLTMDAIGRKRAREKEDAMDAPEDMNVARRKRRRVGEPLLAFVINGAPVAPNALELRDPCPRGDISHGVLTRGPWSASRFRSRRLTHAFLCCSL